VVRPEYGRGSLSDLLPSVRAALSRTTPGQAGLSRGALGRGAGSSPADPLGLAEGPLHGVRRVVVLLLDGLGWHQLPLAAPHAPTLADMVAGRLGSATPLTCGFPSTTPTSLASLGTGAPPGQHGLLGFTVRVPDADRTLVHTLWRDDPDPATWQPVPTQFSRAVEAGIASSVVTSPLFEGSGLTVAAYRGATFRPALGVDSLAAAVLAEVAALPAPALVHAYHPDIDSAGHQFGLDSPPWRAAVAEADRLITQIVAGLPADAALVVTADHGQLDIPPENRTDCQRDPALSAGVSAVAGEPRVRYVHVEPGALADVRTSWQAVLGAGARVLVRDEAVAEGWFGAVPAEHLRRMGDLVVICQGRQVILAGRSEPARVGQMIAFHGSVTATEMMIPLLVVRPT